MTRSRREVLAVGAATLCAGCTSGIVGSDDSCIAGVDVAVEAFDPARGLAVEPSRHEREIVAEAIDAGSAERTTYGERPLEANAFVEMDGAFYEINVSVAEAETVTAYRLRVDWERGRRPPNGATTVRYAELPEADREALELAVYGSEERERHPEESLGVTDFPAPYPDGGASSELAGGGVAWVRWNGRTYRVEVDGSTTRERRTFRYGVERVAASADEFRDVAASRFRIDLRDLPDESTSVVARAREDGYRECTPASERLQTLRNRLPDDRRLRTPRGGWYVRFEGDNYHLSIRQWEE